MAKNQSTYLRISSLYLLMLVPSLAVLYTVFIINNSLANGVVTGKYFWFYACMGLMCVTSFIGLFYYKKSFRFSLQDTLILLFAGSVYLSAFIINDASQNTTKLTLFALLLILYFEYKLLLNVFDCKNLFFIFFMITGLVEAVWGLMQLYGFDQSQHSLFKMTGSFFNPGPYAGYLSVVMPMAWWYFLKHGVTRSKFTELHRVFYGIAIVTIVSILLVLPAAMSRASWLAAIAGSMIVFGGFYSGKWGVIRKYYRKYKNWIWCIGIVAVLLSCMAFTGMYLLKKDSADGRLLMWKISAKTIVKHPLGVGLGNFSGAYGDTQADYFSKEKASDTEKFVAGNPEYAFNEYLQILIESGIISFVLFIIILLVISKKLIRQKEWGILGSLSSLCIFACFSYPFSILPFLIVLVLLLASADAQTKNITDEKKKYLSGTVLSGFICITVCFCLIRVYPMYKSYKQWNLNKIFYNAGIHEDAAKEYEKLYPQLNDQIQYLFEYAQCLSKSEQYASSNKVLERAMQISCDPMLYNIMGKNYQAMKVYEEAESNFIKSINIVPSRIYPWYLLAKLYDEMEYQEKATNTAKIVLTKEPKVQSMAVKEMREEIKELIKRIEFIQ